MTRGLLAVVFTIAIAAIVFATDRSYCEAPHPVAVVPNPVTSTLLQVFVLSRHGDRSPLHSIPKEREDKRVFWNCTLPTPLRSLTQNSSLKSGAGVYFLYENHGAGVFGNQESWNGNCQTGQLTQVGGEMCTRMGAGLREIYIDKFHLLPDTLTTNDIDLLYLRTTDVVRTRESLASLMEGLYPADKHVGVYLPVHVIPTDTDYLHPNTGACPRLSQLITSNTLKDQDWMERFNSVKDIVKRINLIAGTNGSSTFDDNYTVGNWADIFHARECHNMPYPCTSDGQTCVTQDMVDAICEVDTWDCVHCYVGDEANRLSAGPFFVDVSEAFSNRIAGKGPRYIHYSAHDSTIATVLASLKFEGVFPPYASTVRFELWQTASGSSPQYAVQMIYNNLVIRPPECSADMCPLNEFQSMVSSRLTIHDAAKECAKK